MEMTYHFKGKKPNNQLLIPVASEQLDSLATQLKFITVGDVTYKVYDYYYYEKECAFPRVMMYLATGLEITPAKLWSKYPKSKGIYFFVVGK